MKTKHTLPIKEENDTLVQARIPSEYVKVLRKKGVSIPEFIRQAIKQAALDIKKLS